MRSMNSRRWLSRIMSLVLLILVGATSALAQDKPRRSKPKRGQPVLLQRNFTLARQSNNTFREPEEEVYGGQHDLHLAPVTLTIPGGANDQKGGPQDFQLLTYNGRPIGPTIRVRRGSTFSIRVKNHLHNAAPDVDPGTDRPHGLCTTNLHTHGLHVSPADPSDNIFRCIEPDQEYTYTFTIPKNHPSGTFWYHPHKHGSVAYQLSNGLAGALIVDGTESDQYDDLEDIPEIANAKERVLIFQQFNYSLGSDGIARINANLIYNYPDTTPNSCEAIKFPATSQDVSTPITPINGVVTPTIYIAPGEVQRWRLIHAGWEEKIELVWVDEHGAEIDSTDEIPGAIQFREIAKDGLATGSMTIQKSIELYPAYRSDVLIKAPALPKGRKEIVFQLKQAPVTPASGLRGNAVDSLCLANVVVRGRNRHMKLPDPRELVKCRPYPSIRKEELSPASLPNPITFASNDGAIPNPTYLINYVSFHDQKPVRIKLGTAEEWTLKALPSDPNPDNPNRHPFHIHVNPFQVVAHTDATGKTTAMDVWKDTLLIPKNESYTIRSRFLDFPGKTVFHCHILDHEDQGMMMPLEFYDPDPSKPAPAQDLCPRAATPNVLKQTAVPAPALKLPDTIGGARDLTEFRRRTVALVFFQGAECAHCASSFAPWCATYVDRSGSTPRLWPSAVESSPIRPGR